jgi:hypothetical protein
MPQPMAGNPLARRSYGASVETCEIERYLVEDLGWKPVDAAWVKCRIDTGLDILAIDRKF